ncbi:hypothetical protein STRDD11_00929 [Streptococcus sp. DD11]|nr:hypothetical protein STRDD11_00929 [Streptococcus sp. DD11]
MGIPLDRDADSVPKELGISEMQPIRILKGDVWEYYDEE